jgi:1-acyl-sn-glycerol-3-phosphate acyltransferase
MVEGWPASGRRATRVIYVFRYLLIVVYTIFWGVVACLALCVDRSGESAVWAGRGWVGWIFASCGIRVEAEGLEHVDRTRPQIFMCNHQSVVDIGALIAVLPVSWRFVAKRELLWIPLFGWALGLSRHVIVDRLHRQKAVASLKRAAERIREGVNVIIFPEGTRSPSGELGPFKSGGFHLAIEAQVPIVPVTVSGSRHITPKRSLRVESGRVKVVFGEPIPTKGLSVEDRQALKEAVRRGILAGYDEALQHLDPGPGRQTPRILP